MNELIHIYSHTGKTNFLVFSKPIKVINLHNLFKKFTIEDSAIYKKEDLTILKSIELIKKYYKYQFTKNINYGFYKNYLVIDLRATNIEISNNKKISIKNLINIYDNIDDPNGVCLFDLIDKTSLRWFNNNNHFNKRIVNRNSKEVELFMKFSLKFIIEHYDYDCNSYSSFVSKYGNVSHYGYIIRKESYINNISKLLIYLNS